MPPALQFLVLTFAGWVNRHQDNLIDYLREELNPSPTSGRMNIFTPIGFVVLGGRGCPSPAYVSSLSWLSLSP